MRTLPRGLGDLGPGCPHRHRRPSASTNVGEGSIALGFPTLGHIPPNSHLYPGAWESNPNGAEAAVRFGEEHHHYDAYLHGPDARPFAFEQKGDPEIEDLVRQSEQGPRMDTIPTKASAVGEGEQSGFEKLERQGGGGGTVSSGQSRASC